MSFSYNKREILRDVDISVDEGEIVSLLGPNGVGKTTLMKCLCGILKPSHGKVMVNNTDLSNISLRDRSKLIAYVPQRFPRIHSTVMDYILVGRRPYIDVNIRKEDMGVVWEVVHAMDLDRFAVKCLDTLSGGEFQKVQIARALVQEAGTLLLDEHTSNLDISNAYETMHIIRDKESLESMIMELGDCDDVAAMQAIVNLIASKNANASSVAREHYEFVTGEEYTDFATAEKWVRENCDNGSEKDAESDSPVDEE